MESIKALVVLDHHDAAMPDVIDDFGPVYVQVGLLWQGDCLPAENYALPSQGFD